MDASIPDKVYFRIGEVSRILGVEPYVIRYWESEFTAVKPVRTRSDQRLYRRRDVEMLLTIKHLLYVEHFTIIGAKRKLVSRMSAAESEDGAAEYISRLMEIKSLLQQVKDMLQ
jgi:DNA-binding transcriptional MerR regulator